MLLSRALMRGYGMSRFAWPIHFGLLHNDAMWVFDETQIMGVAVETSAQLAAFRQLLGTSLGCRSLWMSATLGDGQLDTVDHPRPASGWSRLELGEADRDQGRVIERLSAKKSLQRSSVVVPKSTSKKNQQNYADDVAEAVLDAHVDDTLTLVIVNRVGRAQRIYQALVDAGRDPAHTTLLHSRYRPADRGANEEILHADGDRIVVATQVVEAGVDVSARTMFTELAPWPSLVQRFGRCNRSGEFDEASVFWLDVEFKKDGDASLLPYEIADMQHARELLDGLNDVGPAALGAIDYEPPMVIRPVLRRKDLLELFDTTPDLAGNDLDVSRYIRDGDDTDALVFWRAWTDDAPPEGIDQPRREELCRVSIGRANKFVGKTSVTAWVWDALDGVWRSASRVRPGQTILLGVDQGGYDAALGWSGKKTDKPSALVDASPEGSENSQMDGNKSTDIGNWVALHTHLEHVGDAVRQLSAELELDSDTAQLLERAAHWHDVGKAHEVFQRMLVEPAEDADDLDDPPGEGPWAKSNHRRRWNSSDRRPHFRHELASALAFLQTYDGQQYTDQQYTDQQYTDLIAYLIAAHHGKVRLSIRSLPGEKEPTRADADGLFARGVWHHDDLPPVDVPGEGVIDKTLLDLRLMRLGRGSWLERTLALRDHPELGPFRLAWLESLLRLADHRASAAEKRSPEDVEEHS
jgi:CRISPR-associated endonuclease/helicase Cas3